MLNKLKLFFKNLFHKPHVTEELAEYELDKSTGEVVNKNEKKPAEQSETYLGF